MQIDKETCRRANVHPEERSLSGSHAVKFLSKSKSLVVFSSVESELFAALKSAAERFSAKPTFKDLGINVEIEVFFVASAALSRIARRDVGTARHLDISHPRIQETAAKRPPADLMT